MPPEIKCPYCGNIVPDWHFEWHSRQDQSDVFSGKKVMECPLCGAGVAFDGFTVMAADPELVTVKRDLWQAARWARNQDKSLQEYLQTREGEPYLKIWSVAEVDAADKRAAAELP
jgi:sarcosine oxidase delta subunit